MGSFCTRLYFAQKNIRSCFLHCFISLGCCYTIEKIKVNNFKHKYYDKRINLFYNINNIPKDEKMLWVICYEPLVGFDCALPNNKENEWNLVITKKNHLLNSRLFEINN